jgi:hypothetical protein
MTTIFLRINAGLLGLLFLLIAAADSRAHSGGMNAAGCHNDYAKGECHCHRDADGNKIPPQIADAAQCGKAKAPSTKKRSEADYAAEFCHARDGQLEVGLGGGAYRADCVTEDFVFEVDFAPKWQEAVSQARHYRIEANRRAAIVLILEKESDRAMLRQACAQIVDENLDIAVFAVGGGVDPKTIGARVHGAMDKQKADCRKWRQTKIY